MRFIKRSQKWVIPIEVGLAVAAWGAGVVFGVLAFHTPARPAAVVDTRAFISPTATYKEVVANFAGKPYAQGQFQELPGFLCKGWTADKNGHRWVVLRCVR
jgi:hypothetical protein